MPSCFCDGKRSSSLKDSKEERGIKKTDGKSPCFFGLLPSVFLFAFCFDSPLEGGWGGDKVSRKKKEAGQRDSRKNNARKKNDTSKNVCTNGRAATPGRPAPGRGEQARSRAGGGETRRPSAEERRIPHQQARPSGRCIP